MCVSYLAMFFCFTFFQKLIESDLSNSWSDFTMPTMQPNNDTQPSSPRGSQFCSAIDDNLSAVAGIDAEVLSCYEFVVAMMKG